MPVSRLWIVPVFFAAFLPSVEGQSPVVQIEPGLESATKWKWWPVPSNPAEWGFALPEKPAPTPAAPDVSGAAEAPAGPQPGIYEIKRGDALILIAKKFNITVEQLKGFNGLTNNLIRAGDTLRIPTPEEARAIAPPPEEKPKEASKPSAPAPANRLDTLPLQVFLDREGFSSGPIREQPGLDFGKVMQIYLANHPAIKDLEALNQAAAAAVGDGLTTYALRDEDFRFISPPKAQAAAESDAGATKKGSRRKAKREAPPPALPVGIAYEDLTGATMLGYPSPWAFVAERFRCSYALLRSLNQHIDRVPVPGTEFRVPNVVPFEIENAFDGPLQPLFDPQNPVTAAVIDQSLLEIRKNGRIVAVMPIHAGRPGLRGKDMWKILEAIPRPRLATLREPRDPPRRRAQPLFGIGDPDATPEPTPTPLPAEEYIAAGPRSPVGLVWINLAKADSPEALPFGLHGTSTPDQMASYYSLGGFRTTNWDIVRAARLLPAGTPLEWKDSLPPPVAAPPPPSAAENAAPAPVPVEI